MDPTEESFVAQVREASVAQVTHPACEPRCETAREVRRSPSFMELTEDLLFWDQRAIKQCDVAWCLCGYCVPMSTYIVVCCLEIADDRTRPR